MTEYQRWTTIPEVVAAARSSLTRDVWDYADGGSETETTLRRNLDALHQLALVPRVLRDVSQRDLGVNFLGHRLALPVVLAPIGSISHFDPGGALTCAQVAHAAGTAAFISTVSSPSLETVRQVEDVPLIFQLYVKGDRNWVIDIVQRAESSGYQAVCVTVDSAVYGRRERDLENRFFPRDLAGRPNMPDQPIATETYQAAANWSDIEALRETTALPIVLKGILSPADAKIAVDHGIDAVYVSNHGGRQLDQAPSTIEMLPEIVDAVCGRAEIVIDSGFMRGTDIVKALALGADAVGIGRLMAWGLAAGGAAGLTRVLELLTSEIDTALALVGAVSIAELGPEVVRRTTPARPPSCRKGLKLREELPRGLSAR